MCLAHYNIDNVKDSAKKGQEDYLLANQYLANVLGRMDSCFDLFVCLGCSLISRFPDFWAPAMDELSDANCFFSNARMQGSNTSQASMYSLFVCDLKSRFWINIVCLIGGTLAIATLDHCPIWKTNPIKPAETG